MIQHYWNANGKWHVQPFSSASTDTHVWHYEFIPAGTVPQMAESWRTFHLRCPPLIDHQIPKKPTKANRWLERKIKNRSLV